MKTEERDQTAARPRSAVGPPSFRRVAVAVAGPALIVISVLVALRGFAFAGLLTNQHPDILTFWLPRSCLIGRSLAAGHVPLWNPFEMAGTPFAADPQSGWLYLPWMALSTVLPCGAGLQAFIVVQPILAGLGLFWFLRRERLGRVAATAGGLSIAMMIAASNVAISLPFSGTLAWTPFVLVGASGFLSEVAWPRRLAWLALGAIAWGQVANAHLSHGLLLCTGLVLAYVIARSLRDHRSGERSTRMAVLLGVGFVAFLPLANLAILVPRFAWLSHSSLRGGYAALGGTLARVSGIADRPIPTGGIWSAWPLALAGTPGAYAGAAILLAIPAAFRSLRHRYLTAAFVATGVVAYLLSIGLLVGAAWFRDLVLRLPFGDVYLHNPGRLRYLIFLVGPVLGAIGLQGFLDRSPSRREAASWLGGAAALFLVVPLALGAHPQRFVVFALGLVLSVPVLLALFRGKRWAMLALPVVLAVELLGGALWSSDYRGGTVYFGLEKGGHPALSPQPLRWPNANVGRYLTPGPIADYLRAHRGDGGRYLAWIPPAAYFNKGYLFSQNPEDWPALLLGRAVLFRIDDVLGYSPVQLPRYWSYIRAVNRLPVYYNASVMQLPTLQDLRMLGVRYLVVAQGVGSPPGVTGQVVSSERSYDLEEVTGWEPRVSVVPTWLRVQDGVGALAAIRDPAFDPGMSAVVEGDPGLVASQVSASPGTATYREVGPEDVRITAHAGAPSIAVVRNAWARGWSATVDGQPAPLLLTDYFLQGVPVPAGTHEIRLTYHDPWIGRGLALSGLVWLAWLAVLVAFVVIERRRRAGASAEEVFMAAPPGSRQEPDERG